MNMKLDTIFIGVTLIFCQQLDSSSALKTDVETHKRDKRFVFLETAGLGVSLRTKKIAQRIMLK